MIQQLDPDYNNLREAVRAKVIDIRRTNERRNFPWLGVFHNSGTGTAFPPSKLTISLKADDGKTPATYHVNYKCGDKQWDFYFLKSEIV